MSCLVWYETAKFRDVESQTKADRIIGRGNHFWSLPIHCIVKTL